MTTPPIPPNETRRLEVLRELAILDSPPDERLDMITAYCQSLFGVSIALVSLVDEERQWFASRRGLDVPETPRDFSFCAHAVATDTALVVKDATRDPRFADNPLVTGPPGIRFYAGAPVRVRGQALGTVCLIDPRPRDFSTEMLGELQDLADAVAWSLERRSSVVEAQAPASASYDGRQSGGGGENSDPWRRLVLFCQAYPRSHDAALLKEIALELQSRSVPKVMLQAKAHRLAAEAGDIARHLLDRVA